MLRFAQPCSLHCEARRRQRASLFPLCTHSALCPRATASLCLLPWRGEPGTSISCPVPTLHPFCHRVWSFPHTHHAQWFPKCSSLDPERGWDSNTPDKALGKPSCRLLQPGFICPFPDPPIPSQAAQPAIQSSHLHPTLAAHQPECLITQVILHPHHTRKPRQPHDFAPKPDNWAVTGWNLPQQ